MKKAILSIVLGLLLSSSSLALQYLPILYDFGGLNNSGTRLANPTNNLSQMTNFVYDYAGNNLSTYKGVSKTQYPIGNLVSFARAGRGRGLYQFYPNQGTAMNSKLISARCVNDYLTLEVNYDSTTMETVAGTALTSPPYHTNFESFFDPFRATDTLYMSNGYIFKKWFSTGTTQESLSSNIYDTSATPNNIGVMTWTNRRTTVTKASGTLDATVTKGAWIRPNASSPYYEVNYVTSSLTFEIRSAFSGTTTTDGSAQIATQFNFNPRFLLMWENRLWTANFARTATDSIVGTAIVGTARIGGVSIYKAGTVLCSAVLSSATPNALEQWTGNDNGYIYVGQNDNVTWLDSLSDYLFVFKEKQYVVYRYNASYLPPIVEVKRFNYANMGQVVNVGDSLIYFTGKEVRQTNGFSDVKISDDIDFELQQKNYYNNSWSDFYSLSASDNLYPTAYHNKAKNQYILYITPRDNNFNIDTTKRIGYVYDLSSKKWIGTKQNNNVGNVINYYPQTSNDIQKAYLPYSSNSSINYFDTRTNFDNQTVGTIESEDLAFDSPGLQKKIYWVEYWVHRQPVSATNESVTLSFNYYSDGNLKLTTPLTQVVYPLTATPTVSQAQIQKIRFQVNTSCNFFKWKLSDTAWKSGATNGLSILGGRICYDVSENN
jgi:hypothetical protein